MFLSFVNCYFVCFYICLAVCLCFEWCKWSYLKYISCCILYFLYRGILDIKFCGFKKVTGVMHRLACDSVRILLNVIVPWVSLCLFLCLRAIGLLNISKKHKWLWLTDCESIYRDVVSLNKCLYRYKS